MFTEQSNAFFRFLGISAIAVGIAAIPGVASAQWILDQKGGSSPNGMPASAKVKNEEIQLAVGEQQVIPSDNVRSYSEGAKGIVDIRLTKDSSQFVIVGTSPGTTTLLFLMMDGSEQHLKITVTDPNGSQKRVANPNGVEARDNIRLDFYFVQVNKSYGHQLGVGWPGSIQGPAIQAQYDLQRGVLDSATAVITEAPLPRLDIAQTSGWAKVMRQAAVVTANGEKASFSGGGEVNVLVTSALTTGVQKISFGSVVEVEPIYDSATGRIELRLHADISELESDRGTGVPGRTTAALDTLVNLELGQSLILAGLSAKAERHSMTGLPGLSQIPLIGIFFGSHQQAEDETENVVLIVPSVVDAVSMQDRGRMKYALDTYEDYDGDLEGIDFVPDAPSKRKPPAKAKATSGAAK